MDHQNVVWADKHKLLESTRQTEVKSEFVVTMFFANEAGFSAGNISAAPPRDLKEPLDPLLLVGIKEN